MTYVILKNIILTLLLSLVLLSVKDYCSDIHHYKISHQEPITYLLYIYCAYNAIVEINNLKRNSTVPVEELNKQ